MTDKVYVIVDLDGTLCNSSKRDHLAQAGLWDDFHGALWQDNPWEDVLSAISALSFAGYEIIGLTGRNERYREATMRWLNKHDVMLDGLLMRPDNDYGSDTDVKPRLLAEKFDGLGPAREQVLFILEDRDKMVEEWRNLGFRCWQVQPGGY